MLVPGLLRPVTERDNGNNGFCSLHTQLLVKIGAMLTSRLYRLDFPIGARAQNSGRPGPPISPD